MCCIHSYSTFFNNWLIRSLASDDRLLYKKKNQKKVHLIFTVLNLQDVQYLFGVWCKRPNVSLNQRYTVVSLKFPVVIIAFKQSKKTCKLARGKKLMAYRHWLSLAYVCIAYLTNWCHFSCVSPVIDHEFFLITLSK